MVVRRSCVGVKSWCVRVCARVCACVCVCVCVRVRVRVCVQNRLDLESTLTPEFFSTVVYSESARALAAVRGDPRRVVPWLDTGRFPHDGDPMSAGVSVHCD